MDVTQEIEQRAQWSTPAWAACCVLCSISCVTSTLPQCTPLCKSRPAFFNFRGLAPASLSRQPQPAKPAIFGKNGGKTINLVGTFLHNGVQTNIGYTENQFEEVQ